MRAVKSCRHGRGITPRTRLHQRSNGNRPSHIGEIAGRNITISSVIAGTTQDQHTAGFRKTPDGMRHRPSGILHQGRYRNETGCNVINTAHLIRREDGESVGPARHGECLRKIVRRDAPA